jgi:predicted phosphate transport protein (TIGR00153 family)
MGSLIEYLKIESAKNVLTSAINHAHLVQKCVKELHKGVQALLKDREVEKSRVFFQNVDLLEDEADKMRRAIQKDISRGELNPSVRTDLSHLIKRLDDVANCANGVARRISTISTKFWEQSSENTINLTLKMMNTTVECVEFLDKMVLDLLEERKNVKDYARQINFLEHRVDELNIKLRESLQETDYSSVNYFTLFTVGNVFDILEAISDAIEEVADYIFLLLSSSARVM